MSNKYIGEYCPVDSVLHKMNPSIKLINLLFVILMFVMTNNLYVVLGFLVLIGIYILISRVPISFYFRIVFMFIYLFLLLAIILVLCGIDINVVGIIILKIVIILLNLMIIVHTTSTNELLTGCMKIVNVLNIYHINFNKLGITICKIIKAIPTFYKTLHQCLESQANRGIDYKYVTIIGRWKAIITCLPRVFVITSEKLHVLGLLLEQKLFNINYNRRKFYLSNIGIADYIFFFTHILIFVYYMTRLK